MAGKYSGKSGSGGASPSSNNYSEDLEERYDIRIDSEIGMVQDNISRLQNERRLINDTVEALADSMDEAEPGSATYNRYQNNLADTLDDLAGIDTAINLHQDLEFVLNDMNDMLGAYRAESAPANELINTMDELNQERNNLIDRIDDTGYTYW